MTDETNPLLETATPTEGDDFAQSETTDASVEGQTDATTEVDDSPVFVDIDGEQTSLDDIRAWKSGHMMQSDYTKGKTELAKDREAVTADQKRLTTALSELESIEDDIAGLIVPEDERDLSELLDDPAEYVRVQHAQAARQKQLEAVRAKRTEIHNQMVADSQEKLTALRGWNSPEKQQQETALVRTMITDRGIDPSSFAKIVDPNIMSALIDAARHHDLQKRKPAVVKAVKDAPKNPAGDTTKQAPAKSMADVFYKTT